MSDGKKSKLAAIMFTDIVGYSSIMERDENAAMKIIEEHNHILLPIVEGSDGKTVDAIGDGLLIVFDSVLAACNCGLNIQNAIASYNEGSAESSKFLLRIGVHLGDIWQDGERIYGNGVNIAARLLPLSEPGGICVSDDVHRQLVNKTDAKFVSIGPQRLKNISQPVVCYRLVTGHERPGALVAGADVVQDKLTEALDKLRSKGISGFTDEPDRSKDKTPTELKWERRIGNFVETVIDKALNKWESVPQEKRDDIVGNIKKQEWYSDTHLSVNLSGQKKHKHEHKDEEKESKDDHKELIPVGIVATAGFGAALGWFGAMWLIFPLIFIGLMPLGIGISHLISRRKRQRREKELMPQRHERLVFEAAAKRGGRLTVMQMSAESGLSLDEAQKVLDALAVKGYVGQEVEDSGLIIYVFPELSPPEDS